MLRHFDWQEGSYDEEMDASIIRKLWKNEARINGFLAKILFHF